MLIAAVFYEIVCDKFFFLKIKFVITSCSGYLCQIIDDTSGHPGHLLSDHVDLLRAFAGMFTHSFIGWKLPVFHQPTSHTHKIFLSNLE